MITTLNYYKSFIHLFLQHKKIVAPVEQKKEVSNMEEMFNIIIEYIDVSTKISNIICSNEPIGGEEMNALKARHDKLREEVDAYKEVVASVEKRT